jgi:TPR repeat protein
MLHRYNAGFCLQSGFGTPADPARAAAFYSTAVSKYGHFGSAFQLGNMRLQGQGVERSVPAALRYLNSINALGPWAGWVRRGLDAYLERDAGRAALCYLHAAELGGFEVAHSNAAFLLAKGRPVPRTPLLAVLAAAGAEAYAAARGMLMSSLGLGTAAPEVTTTTTTTSTTTSLSDDSAGSIDTPPPQGATGSASASGGGGSASAAAPAPPPALAPLRSLQTAPGLYHPSALLRQLLLAAAHGDRAEDGAGAGDAGDAMRRTGDVFYNGQYEAFDARPGSQRALLWYARASARGSAVSSLSLGFMHQFGIGAADSNPARAEKYYNDALQKSDASSSSSSSGGGGAAPGVDAAPVRLLARAMALWLRACRERPLWTAGADALLQRVVRQFDFLGEEERPKN